jgi:tetratricopeptide (TPR) repeat protein
MHKLIILFMLLNCIAIDNGHASLLKAKNLYQNSGSNKEIAIELTKAKYYFSAVDFAKKAIIESRKIDDSFEVILEKLVARTGIESFRQIPLHKLLKLSSPTTSFLAGMRAFKLKKYEFAFKALSNIPEIHRFASEALLVKGTILFLRGEFETAIIKYEKCQSIASGHEQRITKKKFKRYYTLIKENCIIHIARLHYKKRDLAKSIEAYELIEKRSYKWPTILLEKAWANYFLNKYNRSLGLLVTYKSPLLTSYFYPEAELLTGLSYLGLCLWGDALQVVDQYYKEYKPKSQALVDILNKNKNSHNFFINLMLTPISESEKKHPYLRNLMTQIRTKIKFSLDLLAYKLATKELNRLEKHRDSKFIKTLSEKVRLFTGERAYVLNHFVKEKMFDFINQVHKFSYEMFNIQLEIMAKKRSLVYRNKKLIADRGRGSFDNVKREKTQHFYPFKGDFWADEIGDYSFGLKSNCEEVRENYRDDTLKQNDRGVR